MMPNYSLKSRNGGKLTALVIDLQDNGGGLLQGAIDSASLFLRSGKVVVFEISKDGNNLAKMTSSQAILSADQNLPDLSTRCYILINRNSASAAEVFAAAMKVRDVNMIFAKVPDISCLLPCSSCIIGKWEGYIGGGEVFRQRRHPDSEETGQQRGRSSRHHC